MARPKKSSDKVKDYTYRIRLDDEDERKLNELSRYSGKTKADVFRILINDAYELYFNSSKEWLEDWYKSVMELYEDHNQ